MEEKQSSNVHCNKNILCSISMTLVALQQTGLELQSSRPANRSVCLRPLLFSDVSSTGGSKLPENQTSHTSRYSSITVHRDHFQVVAHRPHEPRGPKSCVQNLLHPCQSTPASCLDTSLTLNTYYPSLLLNNQGHKSMTLPRGPQ